MIAVTRVRWCHQPGGSDGDHHATAGDPRHGNRRLVVNGGIRLSRRSLDARRTDARRAKADRPRVRPVLCVNCADPVAAQC
jgi:hypothetical protein